MTILGIDFDGTIVTHAYPYIGQPAPHAIEWLKRFNELGARLILWTMRNGDMLDQAVEYCKSNGVTFWGINENPQQHSWTNSPKAYCHTYIDDAAYGCPLTDHPESTRKIVDWSIVGPDIEKQLLAELATKNDLIRETRDE